MSTETKPATTALSVSTPAWTAGIYGQLDAARPVAELLAKSELVPKGFQGKPMDILIAGAMGARLGLDLFSSLSGIAVVNGRATLWGDALLAVCQQHPAWEDYQQEITGEGDAQQAVVTVKRKGRSPHTETFSVADAKRAGLWGKQGPWSQHPKRMMALRARAFALRTVFADALAGFHAKEEMDDEPREVEATVRSEPRPAKARTVAVVDPLNLSAAEQAKAEAEAEIENKKDEPAAEQTQTEGKTLGEHVADAQAKDAAPAKRDTSVDACIKAYQGLWNGPGECRTKAKAIRAAWNLGQIADLAGAGEDDREAFLIEVENAQKDGGK
jgi:hypothetical protein